MSHTLARPLVRDLHLLRQESKRAFTLIELLAVIAIIALLSAITFGVIKGVQERAAIGQAKAELSVLAQALEEYKRQYGDYPQTGGKNPAAATLSTVIAATDAQACFFSALMGVGPKLDAFAGKNFVDLSKFTLEAAITVVPTSTTWPVANCFLDPWGRRYMYYYKTVGSATWTNASYVLFSTGPDGLKTDPLPSGDPQLSSANNLDNIYANRN